MNRTVQILLLLMPIFWFNQNCLGKESMLTKLVFSNPGYAKEIETRFHVAKIASKLILLESPPKEVEQLVFEAVEGKDLYVFLALKNNGNRSPWGTLLFKCSLKNRKIYVSSIYKNKWVYNLVPIGRIQNEGSIGDLKKAKLKWE